MCDDEIIIEVLGKRVLVQPDEPAKVSKGGIILPDSVEPKPCEGSVLATGPDVEHISIGDRVIYSRLGGSNFLFHDKQYLIIQENDIYGILRCNATDAT